MIIILKENTSRQELDQLVDLVKSYGVTPHMTQGVHQTILGLVGHIMEFFR